MMNDVVVMGLIAYGVLGFVAEAAAWIQRRSGPLTWNIVLLSAFFLPVTLVLAILAAITLVGGAAFERIWEWLDKPVRK